MTHRRESRKGNEKRRKKRGHDYARSGEEVCWVRITVIINPGVEAVSGDWGGD